VEHLAPILDQIGRGGRPLWHRWRNQGFNRNRLRRELGHLTDDECAYLRKLARKRCEDAGIAVRSHRRNRPPSDTDATERVESTHDGGVWTIDGRGRISTLEELLDRADVDRGRWYVESWRANAYEAQRAGGGIVQLWQVKASLREHPAWVWSPVEPRVAYEPVTVTDPDVTLVIPDSQNGYRWQDKHRRLEPLHDRRAWDIAIQVAELIKPARIVLLGDMVDFAEGSKRWPVTPDLRATTQPTIEELHWWLARLRLAAPGAEIVYLEGNHEDRIDRALVGSMSELSDLSPAGEDAALVTWRRLLALDSLGIHYRGPYGERVALAADCEAHHGDTVAAGGGATVARMLKGAHVSQIVGHIHRREYAARTIYGPHGRRTIFAASPGTLCRVDGVVPAVKKRVDWQQGLAVLTYDGARTSCQLLPIDNGAAYIYGERLVGVDPGPDIARDTDWSQLA
jgi:hypothetical protein